MRIDDRKKNALIIRLKGIKEEVVPLAQETMLTEAEEEIMQALKKRGETPEACSPNEIAHETGMPLYVVLDIIAELLP